MLGLRGALTGENRLLRLKARLVQSRFSRGVLTLMAGTAVGQLVPILVSPILTRLYTPEDFGVLAIYASIISTCLVAVSLRFELAIPLPAEERDAESLLLISFGVMGLTVLLSTAAIAFAGNLFSTWRLSEFDSFLYLVPLGLGTAGAYQVLSYWAVRQGSFNLLAGTKIRQGVGLAVTQTTLAIPLGGPLGLILGDVVGRVAGISKFYTLFRARAWRWPSGTHLRRMISRYKRFPLIASGSSLLNSAGLHLAPLLLAIGYGPFVAGSFALAQRIVGLPIGLIGASVGKVYFNKLAVVARERPSDLRRLLTGTVGGLLALGLVPLGLAMLIAPPLFGVVFGADWVEAGKYIQIAAVAYLLQFAIGPVGQTLHALERQVLQLGWDILRVVLVFTAILGSSFVGLGPYGAIAAYTVAMGVCYIAFFWLAYSAAGSDNREVSS